MTQYANCTTPSVTKNAMNTSTNLTRCGVSCTYRFQILATMSCASATTPLPAADPDPLLIPAEPEPTVVEEDDEEEEVGFGTASAGCGGGGAARLKVIPPALGAELEVVEE